MHSRRHAARRHSQRGGKHGMNNARERLHASCSSAVASRAAGPTSRRRAPHSTPEPGARSCAKPPQRGYTTSRPRACLRKPVHSQSDCTLVRAHELAAPHNTAPRACGVHYLELLENGRAIVCDGHVANLIDKHFVETNRAERCFHNVRDRDHSRHCAAAEAACAARRTMAVGGWRARGQPCRRVGRG